MTRIGRRRRGLRASVSLSAVAAIGLALAAVAAAIALVVQVAAPGVPAAPPPITPALQPTAGVARTEPLTSGPAGDAATVTAPCRATARACVELSTQHVWLLRTGTVVRDAFISSGATDMSTPTGIFRVQYKDATHYSSEYHTPMPYAVFFDHQGDALHQGSLARQSRGCVHLDHEDAVAFFEALHPGDEVQILP